MLAGSGQDVTGYTGHSTGTITAGIQGRERVRLAAQQVPQSYWCADSHREESDVPGSLAAEIARWGSSDLFSR